MITPSPTANAQGVTATLVEQRGEVSCTLEEIVTRAIVHANLSHPARVKLLREIEDMARNALLVAA